MINAMTLILIKYFFPFSDGAVPRRLSNGAYVSQPIRFARVCRRVDYFNARNNSATSQTGLSVS